MSNTVTKDFFLTLAWIKSGENTPTSFEVVFALKNPKTMKVCKYLAFVFNSYDLMHVYLKSLAKKYQVHCIDYLFHGDFPVKVKYSEEFNNPDVFESMIVNNTIWPSEMYPHARFKIESFV